MFPDNTLMDDAVSVEAVIILEADTNELTASVEKLPVPGALLLILDTVKVERARNDVVMLDITMVDPNIVEPVRVETVMVLPRIVEYSANGAAMRVVSERVLPVRVDKSR
jgi:hypothetical protein